MTGNSSYIRVCKIGHDLSRIVTDLELSLYCISAGKNRFSSHVKSILTIIKIHSGYLILRFYYFHRKAQMTGGSNRTKQRTL